MKVLRIYSRFCSQIIKPSEQLVRVSKWLSAKAICSRKQAEIFIDLGLVRIDGKRIYENMLIPYDAKIKAFTASGIRRQKPVIKLWMMNKPRGYICTHNDTQNRKTIYQLLPESYDIYGKIMSIGRLDYNSEGLILLTNDVDLKKILQDPQSRMLRYYRVKVHGRVTQKKLQNMSKVTVINGREYGPLKVTFDRQLSTNVWLKVSMIGGRNREIRRIMQKNDLQVNKLIREEYGPYKLTSTLNHGEVKQVEITPNLQKKIRMSKVRQMSNGSNYLVQIDMRSQSIQLAIDQKKKSIEKSEKTNIFLQ